MKGAYLCVGTFQKPVGLEGELKVEIREAFQEEFVQCDHVFVLENGNYIPWFIEDMRFSGFLIVKLEEVDTPEDAVRFSLADIYIKSSSIASPELITRLGKQDWVGFTVYDKDKMLGIIDEILTYPGQELASVRFGEKKILIPLADPLITSVDNTQKTVHMTLPEGLYD
jgi:16S rRNA processing protein RimM